MNKWNERQHQYECMHENIDEQTYKIGQQGTSVSVIGDSSIHHIHIKCKHMT